MAVTMLMLLIQRPLGFGYSWWKFASVALIIHGLVYDVVLLAWCFVAKAYHPAPAAQEFMFLVLTHRELIIY